ncbi:hypothetical protein GW17_00001868 [Ensete ventricosum]|nr:hypothetical protein GW17_00001868 [Ensete ventricosum]
MYFTMIEMSENLTDLCDQMLFNHDPPRCYDCQDCGGPSRCGTMCSALVANNIGGYFVCTTIGKASNLNVALIGNI